jgi:hypothetical protein
MFRLSSFRMMFAITLIIPCMVLPLAAQAPATAPDAGLYTNYFGSPTSVNWIVCGSTQQTEGCYDSGNIGPFVAVGAMLESNPSVSGDVVTRNIYVVDSGDTAVKLYVYKKTDTVTSTFDTTTVTLSHTVTLPLTGGSVVTYMAANTNYLFIGTSQSLEAVEVRKSTLAISRLGIISGDITSITSDEYGYVTVAQSTGFDVYGPTGSLEEDGGGSQFMLGTTQAIPASTLLTGDFSAASRAGSVHSKAGE